MSTLYLVQFSLIVMYITEIGRGICLFVTINKLLDIQLPVWILFVVSLRCLTLSLILRIVLWKKKAFFLSHNELNHLGTKMFFVTAYFEIFLAVFGVVLLSSVN